HNLWDVIVNGDLEKEAAPSGEQSAPPVPKTAKQLAAKRNQERVKSILLLAIPDEYLLKFPNVPDAKSLWAAIKSRFRGNEESKKMQKNVHGDPISKEDINQKFLRSLHPSWNQIALIMRNKPDIDEIDIYDLYNNLRVYEDEIKSSLSSTSNSQNLAFLSSENTSSTNEVSTANGDFRIDEDDLEELDLRWQVAMLTVRVKKFIQKSGRNLDFKEKRHVSFDKSKVECYNCHRKGHFVRECKSGRNQGRRSYGDNGRSNAPTNESSSHALVAQDDLGGYGWSNDFEVELVNYALLAISSLSSSSSSDNEELEKVVKERDELKDKIVKWEESSKNLNELLNSQMSAKDKTSLGYGTQLNEMSNNSETDSEMSLSVFDVRLSDEENTAANDRFFKDGFHVVPPPITGNFLTLRADISFAGLDEYAIRKKIIESTELNTKTSETVGKTNEANTKKPKSVGESVVSNPKINRDRVITEDWNSDDEDDASKVQTVSHVKTNETQTVKSRVDKFGQTSQKQGIGFKKIKACFVCKSIDHLIKDCNFHDKKSQEPKLKNVVNTGPRVDKPVWDNTKRVKNMTTAETRAIVNTGKGKMDTDLKKSRWVWRPKGTYLDHVSKDSGSFMLKKFEYGNPKILLQDHAVVDSGCSSHMTGNKAYLSDYEDYNGGFVAFRSDPKGGKNNSLDLKNIVPSRGITCLYANAIADESKLWQRRLDLVRCDNGTEFKNHVMNDFCAKKGIKREFSVARTPQQNGVAKRKNTTLIEAARTMLADSLLPISFWAEAVNTACYVLNRVLVTKPQNKTSYELLIGKFDGKSDEDQPNMAGTGPDWMFDLDFLTNTMNYIPVSVENQVTMDAGIQDSYVAGTDKESTQEYILLPIHPHGTRIPVEDVVQAAQEKPSENASQDKDVQDSEDTADKEEQHQMTESEQVLQDELEKMVAQEVVAKALNDATRQAFKEEKRNIASQKRTAQATSINKLSTGRISIDASTLPNADLPIDLNMPDLEDDSDALLTDGIFNGVYDDKNVGAVADFSNMDNTINVSPIPTLRIHKDHSKEEPKNISQALQDESWIEAMQEELLQFKLQKVWILVDLPSGKKEIGIKWVFRNKKNERSIVVKNKARLVAQGFRQEEEEVYVNQPPGFVDLAHPNKVYKVVKALYGLHQVSRAWYETLSSFLLENGFRRGTIDKTLFIKKNKSDIIFQMSSMGELTFFLGLQVKQQPDGIFISQDKYVADILKKFDFWSIRTSTTPILYLLQTFSPKDSLRTSMDLRMDGRCAGSFSHIWTSMDLRMDGRCAGSFSHICTKIRLFTTSVSQDLRMANLKYSEKHNMVAFLKKPNESVGFTEIVNFLKGSSLRYALTHNPTIYDSLVKQFWQIATVRTLANGIQELVASIDNKEYTIIEAFVRGKLQLADATGINNLPDSEIYEGLTTLGPKSGGWDQFGSPIATALICLSSITTTNNRKYLAPTLTKNIFSNMKRGYAGEHVPLLPLMSAGATPDQGEGSAVLADSQPPLDPAPSTSQPQIPSTTEPPHSPPPKPIETEEEATTTSSFAEGLDSGHLHESLLRSNEAPLQEGHTSGDAEDNLQLKELMELVPKLVTRIDKLEKELHHTKSTYGKTVLTLVDKVKSLELALKRKTKKVVVTDLEDEETENQGRKIQDIDDDPLVSLVRESMKEEDFVTPTKVSASWEVQEEDISPTILEAAKTLSKVASQRARSTDKGRRYKMIKMSKGKDINTGLDAKVEVNTGSTEVNTGSEDVNTSRIEINTGSVEVNTGGRENTESVSVVVQTVNVVIPSPFKKAMRLQSLQDEEAARQVYIDALLAKRIQKEQELSEQQQKRKAEVQEAAQYYTKEDWDTIRAKLKANIELTKSLQGESVTDDNFAKRMVEMINQKKKYYAEQKAKAKRSKPMTQARQRDYMSTFIKNQSTWKLAQLKKLTFKELKIEFEKLVKSIEHFVPMGSEERVKREEDRKRKKQIARKGIHTDKTAKDKAEEDMEAIEKGDPSSGSDIPVNVVPVPIKPPSIANWKIIKLGKKGVYQIVREDGTNKIYISFGAMFKDITRDDLIEIYRLAMQRYATNGPEDKYERVFWGDLRLSDIYMLTERRYPLPADVCQAMLDKKLQGDKRDEACYQLLKLIEKQAQNKLP
ncbi:ribonuclease H-like domain-containing protein, partial [Tanacetum coccineum]